MIKSILLIVFFLASPHALRADQAPKGQQGPNSGLDNIKDPFGGEVSAPVPTAPTVVQEAPKPVSIKPKPKPVPKPVIALPELNLQGVIVGDNMHQAIINDQIVPLQGAVHGARLISVTKQGVELLFKGKKFFLKID